VSAHLDSADLPQEEDRVSLPRVLLGTGIVLALCATMVVWAWATTDQVTARLRPSKDFPEERLEPSGSPPRANEALFGQPGVGERLNARRRAELATYRWLDRSRGIVTLPIDQAMDRIAGESTK
jgi:hypothetical protein